MFQEQNSYNSSSPQKKSQNAQYSAYLRGSRYNQIQGNEEKGLFSRTLQTKLKTDIPKQRYSDDKFCSCNFTMNFFFMGMYS